MVGSRVLVRLPNIRCPGELFIPSVGVFRQSSRASWKSELVLAAFFIKSLDVFTAFSTLPLLYGCSGEVVTCSNSYIAAKAENSLKLKGGPLSLWNVLGIPWVVKRFFSFPITAAPVFALCSSSTSK